MEEEVRQNLKGGLALQKVEQELSASMLGGGKTRCGLSE